MASIPLRPSTQVLISGRSAFHLRAEVADLSRSTRDEYSNPWVSSKSRWRDIRWDLDHTTPGVNPVRARMRWKLALPDGSMLIDPQHSCLLDAFRRLGWSLLTDPRSGSGISPGTAYSVTRGVHYLAWWMIREGYADFSELDADASEDYVEDLPGLIRELRSPDPTDDVPATDISGEVQEEAFGTAADDLADLGISQVRPALIIWTYIWRQRDALAEAGVKIPEEKPFAGAGAESIAKKIATRELGKIPWLPDEVATPIMASAMRLIEQPASDVIDLQEQYLSERLRKNYRKFDRNIIENFHFSVLPGESFPWHENLREVADDTYYGTAATLLPVQRLRDLITGIRDAAVIVLQSSAGLRINEVCSLRAGIDPSSGLPACVSQRRSSTGSSDLFYLKGILTKLQAAPVETEWLIGWRPAGDPYIPPPVRAIEVLQKLFAPWREMAAPGSTQRSALIVSLGPLRVLPSKGSMVFPIAGESLRMGQKRFVRRFVDLSALASTGHSGEDLSRYRDSHGMCIVTHQWRKSFARYLFRIDNTLIPAIAQQFKHLSLAMTEQAYIGTDPDLLQDIDAVWAHMTVDAWIRLAAEQPPPLAGHMGERLYRCRAEITAIIEGLSPSDQRAAVEEYVQTHDLRIFFNANGDCFLRVDPLKARCHELAGTVHWANKTPEYSRRSVETCLGCANFAIDPRHRKYWIERYRTYQNSWRAAVAKGETGGYREIKRRADQAAKALQSLKVDLPDLGEPDAE